MRLILFSLVCMMYIQKSTGQVQWQWAKSIGNYRPESGDDITCDKFGNVYIAGTFRSPNLPFGNTILSNNNSDGTGDLFLAKYNASGTLIWAKSFGGSDYEYIYGLTSDSKGNVIIGGSYTSPSIQFGTTTLTHVGVSTRPNGFVTKIDSVGNVLWANKISATSSTEVMEVKTDINDNVYITGGFYGTVTFDGGTLTSSTNTNDIYIAKYRSNGSAVWRRKMGGDREETVNAMDINSKGEIYVTGGFCSSTITIGSSTISTSNTSNLYNNYFIARYDTSGNAIWAKASGLNDTAIAYSIHADALGNTYVTGGFSSPTITLDGITLTNTTRGLLDVFVIKYDSAGNIIWARRGGGSGQDIPTDIVTDVNGSVYVTGGIYSTTATFGNINLINASNNGNISDILLLKYDSAGTLTLAERYGGINNEWANACATDAANNFYMTGFFSSITLQLPPFTLTVNDNQDIFFSKINGCTTINTSSIYTICNGESVIVDGISYSNQGIFTRNYVASNGCDSILTININIIPTPVTTITASSQGVICPGQSVTLSVPTGNSYIWSSGDTTNSIVIIQPGSYSVTVTNNNNCSAASGTYTVSTAQSVSPTVSINLNDSSICSGESVTLSAISSNGGNQPSFLWYKNGQNTGVSANTYNPPSLSDGDSITVRLTSNAVCANPSTVFSSVTITVNTAATVSIGQSSDSLISSVAYGNEWYINGELIPGATAQTYIPTQNGLYTVRVIDSNGCTSDFSNEIEYIINSINTIKINEIKIFPNPTIKYIAISGLKTGDEVKLTNALGQILVQIKATGGMEHIDVSHFPSGIYFINKLQFAKE